MACQRPRRAPSSRCSSSTPIPNERASRCRGPADLRRHGSVSRSASPARATSRYSRRPRSRTGCHDPETGGQVKVTYAERFQRQYQQFKRRDLQTKTGTPLDYVPFLSEGKRAELRAQNIYTVEALAAIDGAGAEEPRPRRPRVEERGDGVHRRGQDRRAEQAAGGRAGGAAGPQRGAGGRSRSPRRPWRSTPRPSSRRWSLTELRKYIATHTGQAPLGNTEQEDLIRMAVECRPSQGCMT